MRSATLYKVLAVLLVLIAAALAANHVGTVETLGLPPLARALASLTAGVLIGVVAALMGVAGGELLIPTIVLLYAVEIKIAGSVSLTVSLPPCWSLSPATARTGALAVIRDNRRFLIVMSLGSITGTIVGGLLLCVVPSLLLVPALVLLLLLSAVKVWLNAPN